MINNASYTSASTIPSKIFCDSDLIIGVMNKRIKPLHIQVNPTNKCPLNCSFCSCKNRNRDYELDFDTITKTTDKFIDLGTKAVTITGGGDPLAYERIADYVNYLHSKNIKVGFVTNGVLFDKSNFDFLKLITWCRISLSDEYRLINSKLEYIVEKVPIDWSFSYVLSAETKTYNIASAIIFSNRHKFTHVRIVDDILDSRSSDMGDLKKELSGMADDKLVIYQGRKTYTKGHRQCLISLLKPNIGPDGRIYACCGIQYSKNPPSLDFNINDSMAPLSDLEEVWRNQAYYDGSNCEKCYYSDYNNILNTIWNSSDLNHKEFI